MGQWFHGRAFGNKFLRLTADVFPHRSPPVAPVPAQDLHIVPRPARPLDIAPCRWHIPTCLAYELLPVGRADLAPVPQFPVLLLVPRAKKV